MNRTRSELASRVLVLDASAAVEIALWTDVGARLAEHVIAAHEVVVPDHFYLETTAAIRQLELRDEISAGEASDVLDHLLTMRARRVDTLPLIEEAWTLRYNVTVGDALYVVVARRLGIPFVTGDVRLSNAPGLNIEVLTSSVGPAR